MSGIDLITQTAHEQMERHSQGNKTSYSGHTVWLDHCRDCRKPWPCPDRVAAERIVHEATLLAARDEKIREIAEFEDGDCRCEKCYQGALDAILVLVGEPTTVDPDGVLAATQMEAYIRRFGWTRISHRPGKWERPVIGTSGTCAPHSLSEAYDWQHAKQGRM